MASLTRGRDLMSGLDDASDMDQMVKRRPGFSWAMPCDPAMLADNAAAAEAALASPKMWMGAASPIPMVPPVPIASPMAMMPGFSPLIMPIPQNEEDVRKMEAFRSVMGHAMLGVPPFPMSASMQTETETQVDDVESAITTPLRGWGSYPADEETLREHIILETELYDELRDAVTNQNHFKTVVSLLDRYFKGALSASGRPKVARLVQNVIDDRATTVDESRKLKHLLEGIKNPHLRAKGTSKADAAYLKQLSEVCKIFMSQYSSSRKVE
ncbi:exodeoxyribonuclease VII large subunit, putative [Babesia ovata]|uniref:Exodeoxyribonuclease VII large subunit, putative n=1 Tax=Babesia ovata TaxID=189622 RepID=A0A2H6KGI5_9APIC|nr:exodeoxyribonuclease VII large subunit, putative [Babesia ovata]GBE62079.1 exodeoxyribonuclease VII large subunit, putative [Babesia ovata]